MRSNLPSALLETPAGAEAHAQLKACVHCGMCNATCPTFELTGDELDGPRGRIWLMKQALEGGEVTRTTQIHLDRCLECRSCETTCPSGVSYHRLLDVARPFVEARVRRPLGERLARWAIRFVTPYPARFRVAVALGRLVAPLLPASLKSKLPPKLAPGPAAEPAGTTRHMALLAGCAQSVVAGHFNAATRRVFARAAIDLSETPGAGCCGAVSFHLGAVEEARAFARRNIDAWLGVIDSGSEAVIVNASGCAAFIQDYGHLLAEDPAYADKAQRIAALVKDPVQVLETADLSATRPPADPRIAVHDPCTLQHGLRLKGRVAALLERLGYQPQPVRDAHLCCGSAGAYSLLQPKFANALKANKLAALNESVPAAIYTGNIGCWMHMAEGSGTPVRHWIEAVDEVTG